MKLWALGGLPQLCLLNQEGVPDSLCESSRNRRRYNSLHVADMDEGEARCVRKRIFPLSEKQNKQLIRTIPGLLVSGFFLWYTFRGISLAQIRSVRLVSPVWILGVIGFTCLSYTLRCVRWTRMMRPTGARFSVCARVLLTSLAANNILPLRIGDIMRVFTYSGDLGTSPSVILSTVILEKLLDIFVLVLLFVTFMGSNVSPHSRALAELMLALSSAGLLTVLLGARFLQAPMVRLFARLPPRPVLKKVEHWLMLALDCIREIGVAGSVLLLLQSGIIWAAEGMIFVSGIHLVGLAVDAIGPWQAVSVANLSYLIPSSPGAIGTFEWAVKTALVSHGAGEGRSAVFALALHAWLLFSVTGVGGLIFLMHRFQTPPHQPLLNEIEVLPDKLP